MRPRRLHGFSSALDAEEYGVLLKRYHDAAGAVVQRFHGFIGQYHGDGLLAYFCFPKAREDAAVLSARAALGILRAIEHLNVALASEKRPLLQVRLGLHSGLVLVGELGGGERLEKAVVIGQVPNLTSRLQSAARPGTAVLSAATWRLVRGAFRGRPLGPMTFRGIAEPVEVYEVLETRG